MKTFKSATWLAEFNGSRAEAIVSAIAFLKSKYENKEAFTDGAQRYTWRAADESGFTIGMNQSGVIVCVSKWNARRK